MQLYCRVSSKGREGVTEDICEFQISFIVPKEERREEPFFVVIYFTITIRLLLLQ